MTPSTLRTETRNGVTLVRLSHGKVNALDVGLAQDLITVLGTEARGASSAVVLTASGTVFSAGVDLHRLTRGGREYVGEFLPLLGRVFSTAFTFPKPLVAAINGHAVAGGCILACACDYRVMARGNGRIGTPELAVGVPFPSVAMEILRLAVPTHRLQALIYGGLTCTPDEALANGLVDEVVSPDSLVERAVELAGRLGALPSASFALTKRLVRQPSWDRVEQSVQSIDNEVLSAWQSPAVLDAVRAYVDRTLKK